MAFGVDNLYDSARSIEAPNIKLCIQVTIIRNNSIIVTRLEVY